MRKFFPALAAAAFVTASVASQAAAATNVITCDPTDGLASVVAVKPAMVNNVTPDAPIGLALKAVLDGCVANTAQLTAWAPTKLGGTPNGALIAKAEIALKAKGFGTCNFAAPTPNAYPAQGTLKIKWLDAAGTTAPKAKTDAYVEVSGDLATISASAKGIVTKGVGVGAEIKTLIGFDLANPINGPVLTCNTGPYAGPSITQIAVVTIPSSTISVDFP